MAKTRGGLVPATIGKVGGSPKVDCMFNPSEYKLSKSNSYSAGNKVGKTNADKKFEQGQARQLTLKLYFDTYQDGPDAEPVTKYTDTLFALMTVEAGDGKAPPDVEFKWGTFSFKGHMLSVNVNFTLFDFAGTPLRATADLTLDEKPGNVVQAQTAGRGWEGQTVRKTADASIVGVAAKFTGNPANYRTVAEANNIDNPNKIPNGTTLKVPTNTPPPPPPPPPPGPPAPPAPPSVPRRP
jgi:hypothetical protein